MLYKYIKKLVTYGLQKGLINEWERMYTTNLLLDIFQEDEYEDVQVEEGEIDLEDTLKHLLDIAYERGIEKEKDIVSRDLLDTKLMNCLVPRPSEVIRKFYELYASSPKEATDYFYKLSQDSDYIRRYRIKKDIKWKTKTPYGELDMTINLSKPEKDPKAIAAAKNAKQMF